MMSTVSHLLGIVGCVILSIVALVIAVYAFFLARVASIVSPYPPDLPAHTGEWDDDWQFSTTPLDDEQKEREAQ